MADLVTNVPLFSFQAFKSFVNGTDKDNRKEGDYKNIEGDFERIPLLAIGWFCLIAARFEKWGGYDFGSVVNLGAIGSKVANLTDYWELVDWLKGGSTAAASLWSLYADIDLTSEKGRQQGLEATKTTVLYAGKAFSNLINFVEMMFDVGALKGFNMHKWKMIGSAAGIPHHSLKLYTRLTAEAKDPEDISEVKKEAREIYKKQYESRIFWGTTITASILAFKVIGFCGAFHAFYGASSVIRFVAERKGDLLFGAFSTFMVGIAGSHLRGQQMKEFKKLNKAT